MKKLLKKLIRYGYRNYSMYLFAWFIKLSDWAHTDQGNFRTAKFLYKFDSWQDVWSIPMDQAPWDAIWVHGNNIYLDLKPKYFVNNNFLNTGLLSIKSSSLEESKRICLNMLNNIQFYKF